MRDVNGLSEQLYSNEAAWNGYRALINKCNYLCIRDGKYEIVKQKRLSVMF